MEEINEEVGLPEERLEEIMGFFAKYRFIQLDRKNRRVKLTSSVLQFFAKTK